MKNKILLIPILITLIGLMAFIIISSNTVSSISESLNKTYDKENQKIIISNSSGVISEIQLKTPHFYKVPLGYQKVAELDFTSIKDFKNYLSNSNFEFIDLRTGSKTDRELDFKFKNNKGEWENLTYYNFEKEKKITIGLFTEVELFDTIEWIPTFYEVRINEWAVWTAELNVNLVSYYKFDEASGSTAEDSTGNNNGTYGGNLPTPVAGIFNNSQDYIVNTDEANVTGVFDFWTNTNVPFAINMWVYSHENSRYQRIVDATANLYMFQKMGTGAGCDNCLRSYGGTGTFDVKSNITLPINRWVMITTSSDGSTVSLYLNNSLVGSGAAGSAGISILETLIGKQTSGVGETWNGPIDEIGFWNSSLSVSQINQLWNDGSGITWTDVFPPVYSLSVNLTSPANNTNFNDTAYLVGNVVTYPNSTNMSIVNVSLMINGTINQTNTSGVEGNYNFTFTPGEGASYLWDFIAFGNDSIQYNSTSGSRIVNITIPPPPPLNAPNQTSNISNFTMEFETTLTINFTDYFNSTELNITNGGYVNISFVDFPPPEQLQSLISTYMSNITPHNYFLGENFYIINERLSIIVGSYSTNRTIVINPLACNNAGCTEGNEFYIRINESKIGIEGTSNFIISTASWFGRIFPDADTLSLFQRLGLVFIVLLVASITAFIGMGAVNIEAPHNSYIVGIIGSLIIIYFTAINYISVWLLIGAISIGIGIPLLLKFKND
jgi:hypothetical protein